MISLLGYNFCGDINCIDPIPTNINNITITKVQNGIYDHINMTRDVEFDYTTVEPTDWDFNTIFNATFMDSISGGNVAELSKNITEIRIKRRIKGTFDWVTIRTIPINDPAELSFIITDNLAANGLEYEYAYVPVTNDVEGNYIVESIMSKFNGVYICDVNTVYKFIAGVSYSSNDAVQKVGVFEPFGRKYPIVVSNSITNYQTGTFSGMILPDDFEDTGNISRADIVKKKKKLVDFLNNKKPKILKDWNGNAWLCIITDNPSISYDNNYGMGIATVSASWTETGDVNNKNDLYENGMIPTED